MRSKNCVYKNRHMSIKIDAFSKGASIVSGRYQDVAFHLYVKE